MQIEERWYFGYDIGFHSSAREHFDDLESRGWNPYQWHYKTLPLLPTKLRHWHAMECVSRCFSEHIPPEIRPFFEAALATVQQYLCDKVNQHALIKAWGVLRKAFNSFIVPYRGQVRGFAQGRYLSELYWAMECVLKRGGLQSATRAIHSSLDVVRAKRLFELSQTPQYRDITYTHLRRNGGEPQQDASRLAKQESLWQAYRMRYLAELWDLTEDRHWWIMDCLLNHPDDLPLECPPEARLDAPYLDKSISFCNPTKKKESVA